MVAQAPEQQAGAEHEQRIGNDGSCNGGLHQHVLAGAQCRDGDDQLCEVAEGGIQEPADGVAGLGGDGLSGVAEQGRQRHDGQHRQYEQQRVGMRHDCLRHEHGGHEDQHPKQRGLADFLEQGLQHGRLLLRTIPENPPSRRDEH